MEATTRVKSLYPSHKRLWRTPRSVLFPLVQASFWLGGCLLAACEQTGAGRAAVPRAVTEPDVTHSTPKTGMEQLVGGGDG